MSDQIVQAYDLLIEGPLSEFERLSTTIGGLIRELGEKAVAAVQSQRQFLVVASKSKQPSQQVLVDLLKPTSDAIQSIQAFREKNRHTDWFNHLSAISESISALGWVTVSPTPGPFVKEMKDSAQFYTNKVLVAFKGKDERHIDWSKAWIEFLSQLQGYIKQFHTTGLSWNVRGIDASSVPSNGSVPPPPPRTSGPLPPPPPPPTGFFADVAAAAPAADDSRQALMRELNRGADITSGLRKVTSDDSQESRSSLGWRRDGSRRQQGCCLVAGSQGCGASPSSTLRVGGQEVAG